MTNINDNKKPIIISKKEKTDELKEEKEIKKLRKMNIEKIFDSSKLNTLLLKKEFWFFIIFINLYSYILQILIKNNLIPIKKLDTFLRRIFSNDLSSTIIDFTKITVGIFIFLFLLKIYYILNKKFNDKRHLKKR